MPKLFDGINGTECVAELYSLIEANCSNPPSSTSEELWKLRRRTNMDPSRRKSEVLLERSVATLAEKGHMPGWYNQCPVASGIVSSDSDHRTAVDLVHWSRSDKSARLIELKWMSGTPQSAIRQILKYGLAYLFCRVHKDHLPLNERPLMDARRVALEIVAPIKFYPENLRVLNRDELQLWLEGSDEAAHNDSASVNISYEETAEHLEVTSHSLNQFAQLKTGGALSMSLSALAFPSWFDHIPFDVGQDVDRTCNSNELSEEGRIVRDAFERLTPAWPEA